MGKASRDKGARGERAVASIYTAEGIPVTRLGNAGELSDLAGLERLGVHPEVKNCARTDMLAWTRQAADEAPTHHVPAVHWRVSRPGFSSGWFVNVPLADFIDLLKEARGL